MSAIWEEHIFLDKETGETLHRFVFEKPYSFLFARADTDKLYKKIISFLYKTTMPPKKTKKAPKPTKAKGKNKTKMSQFQTTRVNVRVAGGLGGPGGVGGRGGAAGGGGFLSVYGIWDNVRAAAPADGIWAACSAYIIHGV